MIPQRSEHIPPISRAKAQEAHGPRGERMDRLDDVPLHHTKAFLQTRHLIVTQMPRIPVLLPRSVGIMHGTDDLYPQHRDRKSNANILRHASHALPRIGQRHQAQGMFGLFGSASPFLRFSARTASWKRLAADGGPCLS